MKDRDLGISSGHFLRQGMINNDYSDDNDDNEDNDYVLVIMMMTMALLQYIYHCDFD